MYYFQRDCLLKYQLNESTLKSCPPIAAVVPSALILQTSMKRGLMNKESLLPAAFYLEMISGQKAIGCRAKKSSANYKIRQGDIIGWKVTLRGKKLEDFLTKWIHSILPIEGNIFQVSNLSSFLELNEQILPEKLFIHVSFQGKSKEISNLLLSNYGIPKKVRAP